MKKLFITIMILLLFSVMVSAKLSDETLKTVQTLRNKHGITNSSIKATNDFLSMLEWTQDFLSIWVKDGILFIETQDGKWYIEMKEVKQDD